jgi:anaerobic selenocysteine-containing dehydrogenase
MASRPFIKVGTGWTRRRNGGSGMRAVCSLAAVLGQGDRVLYESSDHFGLAEHSVDRPDLRHELAHPEPSHQAALGRELCDGRYQAAFVWGHNPAVTLPDSRRVRAGLTRDDLFLVVHEQVMTETARLADVVLPACFFYEQSDVYRSYGHRHLHSARRATEPPAGPRGNLDTFAAIAKALELPRPTWDVTEESVIDELLEASRERIGADGLERLRAGERIKLPPRPRASRGTPSGKIELLSEAAQRLGQPAMATSTPEQEPRSLWLCPAPSTATHNSTFLASPRHLARAGAPCCWINPALAGARQISEGDPVTLESDHGSLTLAARLSDDVPESMVRVDGLPRPADCVEGYGINALVGPGLSDIGDGATFFSTRVDLIGGR